MQILDYAFNLGSNPIAFPLSIPRTVASASPSLRRLAACTLVREKANVMLPAMVEFDMNAIGTFATAFAGPPVKKAQSE